MLLISNPAKEKITRFGKMCNMELHNLYSSDIVIMIRIEQAVMSGACSAHGEMRNSRKTQGKKALRRLKHRLK
jgi:hypothetical protein